MSKIKIGFAEETFEFTKPIALVGQFAERISEYQEKPLTATAMAISSDDEQMVLLDVLCAQQLAVADDDALAVIAAEIGVDGHDRRIAPGNIADRLIDAAAEIVAGKRGAQLGNVRQADIADEIGHAVLLLLLDGNLELVRIINQLARLVELEAGGRLGGDFRTRRSA